MSTPAPHPFAYAYLHGFASSPLAAKGAVFARALAAHGIALSLPDLNAPSFAALDHDAILARLDQLDAVAIARGERWRMIGSSFGGWIAARWASLHPERVERLVLLCPGFELATRWPELLGDEAFARWRERGVHPFVWQDGRAIDVHWRFYEQSLAVPAAPRVQCPTLILHGVRDAVVPIETSRRYVAGNPHARLLELDDEHALFSTIDEVLARSLAFLELPLPPATPGA